MINRIKIIEAILKNPVLDEESSLGNGVFGSAKFDSGKYSSIIFPYINPNQRHLTQTSYIVIPYSNQLY